MKIIANDMRDFIDKSGLKISEIVTRMNTMQEQTNPGRRPITRNSIYLYMNGHTPPLDKIYILSSILRVHPKELFKIQYDEEKLKLCNQLAKELRVTK